MKKINISNIARYQEVWQAFLNVSIEELEKFSDVVIFKPKETIIRNDLGTETLFILLEGKAKVSLLHEDGKQSIVHFVQAGELIGELSLLGVENQTKDVTAQSECLCLAIPFQKGQSMLLENTIFLKQLSIYLAQKLLSRTSRLSEGQNYPLINRLAAFILYTESNAHYHEKHTEVAEYLAVSYRHLLYTFQQLMESGMIEKNKPGYDIMDRNGLQKLSGTIHF